MSDLGESSGTKRGLSGLGTLASTISAAPVISPKVEPLEPLILPAPRQPEAAPSWLSGTDKLWLAVIAAVVICGIVASQGSQNSTRSTDTSSETQSKPILVTPTSPALPSYTTPTYLATETRPPVGTGSILSLSEIRYCLSERIRLVSISDLVEAGTSNQIARANDLVNDYNSRCSNYRYRQADMSSARTLVESNRAALQEGARAMVGSWR